MIVVHASKRKKLKRWGREVRHDRRREDLLPQPRMDSPVTDLDGRDHAVRRSIA